MAQQDLELVKVEGERINYLVTLLTSKTWIEDDSTKKLLIVEISALLVSLDTATYHGRDFKKAMEILRKLLQPLFDSSYLYYSLFDIFDRPLLFLTNEPYHNLDNPQRINVGGLFLHTHIDVAPYLPPFGQPILYHSKNTDSIYGRGVCDMKTQIVIAILLLYEKFHKGDQNNITIAISSDEEMGSPYHKEYFEMVNGALNIDLEPTSNALGKFCNIILPEEVLKVSLTELGKYQPKDIKILLVKRLGINPNIIFIDEDTFYISMSLISPDLVNSITNLLSSLEIRFNISQRYYSGFTSPIDARVVKAIQNSLSGFGNPRDVEVINAITMQRPSGAHGFIEIFGNYATAFSMSKQGVPNTVIFSIPDRGRHTNLEAAKPSELLNMLKVLLTLSREKPILKEQ